MDPWFDGFDHYNSIADMLNGNYTSFLNVGSSVIDNSISRTGNKSLRLHNHSLITTGPSRAIPAPSKAYMGLAIRIDTSLFSDAMFMGFETVSNSSGTWKGIRISSDGVLLLVYDGVTVFTDTIQRIFAGQFYYLEVMVDIVNGEMALQYQGSPLINVSGLGASANALNYNIIRYNPSSTASYKRYIDDLYCNDTGFLGAQRCYTLFPESDQTPQDWALSSGANAYNLINTTPYNTSNYIEGQNVGDKSNFDLPDIVGVNGVVNGVRLSSVMALDAAGAGEASQTLLDSHGSPIISGTPKALSTSPIYYNDVAALSGVSVTDINASELQMERVS